MVTKIIENTIETIAGINKLPGKNVAIDYDREADVLYYSFDKAQAALDSELTKEDIIVRKQGKKIVGVTVLNASRFMK